MTLGRGAFRGTLLFALFICVVALVAAGCRDRERETAAPEAGADVPPIATPGTGPLAGISIPTPAPTPEPTPTPEATPTPESEQEVEPTPTPLPTPSEDAQIARLVVPRAKIDHAVVTKGLTPEREMEDPGGKDDVAWYDFTTKPGFGSNAVMSGHVDWYTGHRGVFWFLRDLEEGDEAQVHYTDGTVITYRVTNVAVYDANDAPVAEITGPTTVDRLTMITCDGVFQRSTRDYTQRRVVYAERVT